MDKKNNISKAKSTAYAGVLTALAMLLSYIESLIPISFAIPGIKLGLANLVTIVALYKLNIKLAIVISVIRIVLSGILFGNPVMIVYSLAGATLSLLIMIIVKKLHFFTVTGVSVCGAIFHNIGQLVIAAILVENARVLYYFAALLVSGTVFGVIIGVLAAFTIKNIHINTY